MATDKATNARLVKSYGTTLAEYDQMLADQNGTCKICSAPPRSRRLHTDHDHAYKHLKIETERYDGGWSAWCTYRDYIFSTWEKKRSTALKHIRAKLKTASVRGLLCPTCNRGLRFYRDNPDFLTKAAEYLRRFNDFYIPKSA